MLTCCVPHYVEGLRVLFGDQAMFCRAIDFGYVGGFDENLPIMEDADLCIRMHEAGPASDAMPLPSVGRGGASGGDLLAGVTASILHAHNNPKPP